LGNTQHALGTVFGVWVSWATLALATWTWLTFKLNIFQQPGLLRIEHRVSPVQRRWKAKSSITRLQGGFHANPFRVLAEDLLRNARDLLTGMFPSFASKEDFSTSAATQPLTIDPENS
jgi:hypothetical protein